MRTYRDGFDLYLYFLCSETLDSPFVWTLVNEDESTSASIYCKGNTSITNNNKLKLKVSVGSFTTNTTKGIENKLLQQLTEINYMYCTIPYHTILYHTIPYHTTPYHSTPYHTIPYYTIPYHTIPYHTILHHTITHHTISYNTITHHTAPVPNVCRNNFKTPGTKVQQAFLEALNHNFVPTLNGME